MFTKDERSPSLSPKAARGAETAARDAETQAAVRTMVKTLQKAYGSLPVQKQVLEQKAKDVEKDKKDNQDTDKKDTQWWQMLAVGGDHEAAAQDEDSVHTSDISGIEDMLAAQPSDMIALTLATLAEAAAASGAEKMQQAARSFVDEAASCAAAWLESAAHDKDVYHNNSPRIEWNNHSKNCRACWYVARGQPCIHGLLCKFCHDASHDRLDVRNPGGRKRQRAAKRRAAMAAQEQHEKFNPQPPPIDDGPPLVDDKMGPNLVHAVTKCYTFTEIDPGSATARRSCATDTCRCELNLPHTFVLGDDIEIRTEGYGSTQKEAREHAHIVTSRCVVMLAWLPYTHRNRINRSRCCGFRFIIINTCGDGGGCGCVIFSHAMNKFAVVLL